MLARAPTDPLMAELIADGGQGYHNSSISLNRSRVYTIRKRSRVAVRYLLTILRTIGVNPNVAEDHILNRSEEHTSELQSLMRISYAVFCLKKKISNYMPTKLKTIRI